MKLFLLIIFSGIFLTASAQLKIGDQPTISQKSVALDVKGSNSQQGLWLPRVTDTSITGIRALNPPDGLVIYHTPSAKMFLRSNNSWVTFNSNSLTGVTAGGPAMTGPGLTYTTGTAGTDFNISSSGNTATWNLPDASITNRGAITIAAQTFGGAKTFNDGATINNGSTLNNGSTANNGLTVSGATSATSNLILGVTSATTPAAATNRYLSVNAAGNVTLNSYNALSITAGGTTMTGPAVTFNTGTSGTDFNISASANTATWNLPGASSTARGVVTTTAQTFAGLKTFDSGVVVNEGANITGASSATTNLKLGVTSATIQDSLSKKFLTVDNAGNVILAKPVPGVYTSASMKSFTATAAEFSIDLDNNDGMIATFTLPAGTNLVNPSTVMMSPETAILTTVAINWAVVTGPTTIKAGISNNHGNKQTFPVGYKFYITVVQH